MVLQLSNFQETEMLHFWIGKNARKAFLKKKASKFSARETKGVKNTWSQILSSEILTSKAEIRPFDFWGRNVRKFHWKKYNLWKKIDIAHISLLCTWLFGDSFLLPSNYLSLAEMIFRLRLDLRLAWTLNMSFFLIFIALMLGFSS